VVDRSAERAGTNARRLLQGALQRESTGRVGEASRSACDGVDLDDREHRGTNPGRLSDNACGQGVAVRRSERRGTCCSQGQNVDLKRHVHRVPAEIRGGARALQIDGGDRENDLARLNRVNGSLEWSLGRHGADRDARQRYRKSSNQSDEQRVTYLQFRSLLETRSAPMASRPTLTTCHKRNKNPPDTSTR